VLLNTTGIVGPGTSTNNGLPLWSGTTGTTLKDGAGQTIAGNYTWGGTQNFTSTMQVGGNTMTFPGVAATLASWGAGNTWAGAQAGTFNVTGTFQIGGTTVALPVTVPNGGTGVATLTAHGVLVGEGTSNVAATATGTAGQVLASGGAGADPSWKTGASFSGFPTNPTGTTTNVMMGLGSTCVVTPVYTGRVHITILGNANSSVVATGAVTLRQGTGAAPANGAAVTGTVATQSVSVTSSSTGANIPFNVGNIVTGLANGTQIWFDLSASAGAGTFTVANITCTAFEF
jgi:hypothetical protein